MENKRRTFEIKMVITVSKSKMIEEMLEMKNAIATGEIQREMLNDGADKVTATFVEIKALN